MSRIFISAAHKSSGKTTVSIGLCAALKDSGNVVQSFKKGPDYIDPYWLSQATGRSCYNLDFYTMSQEEILAKVNSKSSHSDISLIEGNKGLYDGLDLDGSNSNAALATLTKTPVILVLSASGMTRGIAPLILGYQAFDKNVSIQGVILNRLGGSRHESKLRNVIEHYTDVQVVGAIHNDSRFNIDERHLGLVPGHEDPFCSEKIHLLAEAVREQVNLNQVLDIAATAPALANAKPAEVIRSTTKDIKLGLIRSAAFGFYYPDDIEALENAGAEIIEIDPCTDKQLPDIDALFIGGGFPETHMRELEANTSMRDSILKAIQNGLPAYAECGGLMYLAKSIEYKGETHQMVGCIDTDIVMEKRPQGRGYVQLEETADSPWPLLPPTQKGATEEKQTICAHEFHYSRFKTLDKCVDKNGNKTVKFAFRVLRGTGITGNDDGYIFNNLLACYTHQRTSDKNPWTERFILFARQCRNHKKNQT